MRTQEFHKTLNPTRSGKMRWFITISQLKLNNNAPERQQETLVSPQDPAQPKLWNLNILHTLMIRQTTHEGISRLHARMLIQNLKNHSIRWQVLLTMLFLQRLSKLLLKAMTGHHCTCDNTSQIEWENYYIQKKIHYHWGEETANFLLRCWVGDLFEATSTSTIASCNSK